MAVFFSEAAAAAMAEESVVLAVCARFDFPAGEARYWIGHGDIELGGEVWQGLGEFASVSGLTRARNDAAIPLSFTLSGVSDEVAALAVAEAEDVQGRAVVNYMQVFRENGSPLDAPAALWGGSMDRLEFSGDASAQGVSLVCEGLFATRHRAPMSFMGDAEQQRRHPGDLFFEHAAGTIEKKVAWP